MICAALLGLASWAGVVLSLRSVIKFLLRYHGWMYEERGPGRKVSLSTKLWALAIRPFVRISKPQLYSFQGCLPSLPIPALEATRTNVNYFEQSIKQFSLSFSSFLVFEECASAIGR